MPQNKPDKPQSRRITLTVSAKPRRSAGRSVRMMWVLATSRGVVAMPAKAPAKQPASMPIKPRCAVSPLARAFAELGWRCFSSSNNGIWMSANGTSRIAMAPKPVKKPRTPSWLTRRTVSHKLKPWQPGPMACIRCLRTSHGTRTTQALTSATEAATASRPMAKRSPCNTAGTSRSRKWRAHSYTQKKKALPGTETMSTALRPLHNFCRPPAA
mmetsp:Transcript_107349/g.308997  ORF Transcript_107349/g.308997 Transcript_107349/m.308997 type:complete len:213 (-) Transcript_107349:131-769(-)